MVIGKGAGGATRCGGEGVAVTSEMGVAEGGGEDNRQFPN